MVFVELDSFCLFYCWSKEEISMSGGPGKRQFPGLMGWGSGRMFAKGKIETERERAPGFHLCRCRAEFFQRYGAPCKEKRYWNLIGITISFTPELIPRKLQEFVQLLCCTHWLQLLKEIAQVYPNPNFDMASLILGSLFTYTECRQSWGAVQIQGKIPVMQVGAEKQDWLVCQLPSVTESLGWKCFTVSLKPWLRT